MVCKTCICSKTWKLQGWFWYTEVSFKKFISKKVQLYMSECILIISFHQSLSLAQSLSLKSGCEVGCYNMSVLTAVRLRCVTYSEVSGSSLLTSFCGCITCFPPFICMQDQPHFTAQHNVKNAENVNVDFCFWLIDKQKLGCICNRLTELNKIWHHSVKLNKQKKKLGNHLKVGLLFLEQPDFVQSDATRLHRFECSQTYFFQGACPQTPLVSRVFSLDNCYAWIYGNCKIIFFPMLPMWADETFARLGILTVLLALLLIWILLAVVRKLVDGQSLNCISGKTVHDTCS